MISRFELPQWVAEGRQRYFDSRDVLSRETHFYRGEVARQVLAQSIIPFLSPRVPIRILEVGPGLDVDGVMMCPYELYRLASLVEAHGRVYQMTVADIKPEILADISGRSQIYWRKPTGISAKYTHITQVCNFCEDIT